MRDYIRGYVGPDEHVQDPRNCSYHVHSLYLDAPTLVLYRQTTLRLKNRFKLRIRFYDDDPAHPAFLEIKRRLNDVIRKERAAITRAGVNRLLKGRPLDPSDLIPANGNGRAGGALERCLWPCDPKSFGAIRRVLNSHSAWALLAARPGWGRKKKPMHE